MGHVTATAEFADLNNSEKPWELWFIAFFTLSVLIMCMVWVYFFTDLGKKVQQGTSKLQAKLQDFRMKRRMNTGFKNTGFKNTGVTGDIAMEETAF
jgi:hypothetical protein